MNKVTVLVNVPPAPHFASAVPRFFICLILLPLTLFLLVFTFGLAYNNIIMINR